MPPSPAYFLLAVATSLAFLTPAAFADTIFDLNARLDTSPRSNSTLTGTVDINTTTGLITSLDVTFAGFPFGPPAIFTGAPISQGVITFDGMPYFYRFQDEFLAPGPDSLFQLLDIGIPVQSLIDYTGGPICTIFATNQNCNSVVYQLGSPQGIVFDGSLTPEVTPTVPEPSTLVLLFTGALAAVGATRRRLLRA
jgi:PEP-CTERM motif